MGLKEILESIGFRVATHGQTPTTIVGMLGDQPLHIGQVDGQLAWYTPDGKPLQPPPGWSDSGGAVHSGPHRVGDATVSVTLTEHPRRIIIHSRKP